MVHDHIKIAEEEYNVGSGGESDADVSNEDADESTSTHLQAPRRFQPTWYKPKRHHSFTSISDTEAAAGPAPSPDKSLDVLPVHRRWINTFGKRGSYHRARHQISPSSSGLSTFGIGGAALETGSHSMEDGIAASVWDAQDDYAIDMRLTLKRKLVEIYTSLNELQQYAQLNLTGMEKILKKYDKITSNSLKDRYMHNVVKVKYPFQPQAIGLLREQIEEVVHMYARVAARGDEELAHQQLRMQLREEVVWQRNTVWREMINIERRAQAASLEKGIMGSSTHLLDEEPKQPNKLWTPFGEILLPAFLTLGTFQLFGSLLLFFLLLKVPAFRPILRNLPPRSPYATSMVMGIALASNIGGQTSPIASPQNLIALEYMEVPLGWLQWFGITLPRRIENIMGDMAITAVVPLVLFFGSGILTKEDFNNFLWTIVFLAMGGIALGKGVASSGLLKSLDGFVQNQVDGLPLWGILVILVSVGLVVATFISHTIAAVLLVPIAAQMGANLAEPHPRLLIMATALTSSAAMGLPISGFPNMTAINLEDEVGHHYERPSPDEVEWVRAHSGDAATHCTHKEGRAEFMPERRSLTLSKTAAGEKHFARLISREVDRREWNVAP
ncbi:unnamed protein product [Malassezia sympodialis ATCC 42132]|uniref:uncharacterized protein n=1 Tax=Malassezia sympodialis (strain ATCC 42132) TaxID=1230383 RepID=UPI0002C28CDD|nr:uncharacterized protein MSY001_1026 [Malassezia sympodialis ATCC 42132]CCU98320.1 unnamed protein product [Malassezia sympodialis ATCC 42132]|eukprot:XP_018739635.1 uncharacterized protein MSY001_1026 [Malassezia sympodialis ATCC 42132]